MSQRQNENSAKVRAFFRDAMVQTFHGAKAVPEMDLRRRPAAIAAKAAGYTVFGMLLGTLFSDGSLASSAKLGGIMAGTWFLAERVQSSVMPHNYPRREPTGPIGLTKRFFRDTFTQTFSGMQPMATLDFVNRPSAKVAKYVGYPVIIGAMYVTTGSLLPAIFSVFAALDFLSLKPRAERAEQNWGKRYKGLAP